MQTTGLNAPRERQAPGAAPMRQRAVRMPDDEWEQVLAAAAREGCTASTLVRRALAGYLTTR